MSMKADYHVHCHYSDDSDYDMEQVVKDAIAMGLDEIAFTDHVDYGLKTDYDMEVFDNIHRADLNTWIERPGRGILYNVDYKHYFPQIKALQKKYGDQINIKAGLEMGIQKETLPLFEEVFRLYQDELDFILLSVHQLENMEFWTNDYQQKYDQDAFYQNYYKELLWLIRNFKDYSVLAHLDLLNRYDTYGKPYDFEKVKPIVKEILEQVIQDGKGIEVNTSNIRYKVGDMTPGKEILEMYRDLGGEIITIGSDSHKPEHLGTYIDENKQALKELGFRHFYTYDHLKPIAHEL